MQSKLIKAYGNLPLSFEANQGQADSDVKFLARGQGYNLLLTGNEAVLAVRGGIQNSQGKGQKANVNSDGSFLEALVPLMADNEQPTANGTEVLRMKLAGANPNARIAGLDELPGKSHYFLGNDPKQWRTNVPNYAKVKYRDIYAGVDLIYYGNQRQLEYDFVVAPGADPRVIALTIARASSKPENRNSRIDAAGDLVIAINGGEVRFHKPVVYQEQSAVDRRQSSVSGNSKSQIENLLMAASCSWPKTA